MTPCFFSVSLSLKKKDLFYNCFNVHVPCEARRSSEAGVTGSYKPHNIGAGKSDPLEEQQEKALHP